MNKKKVLALMAMLTVTAMVSACGEKKEEAAVTETVAVESTVVESTVVESTAAETAVSENTEPLIEDNSDVALAESVEETEEEMSVVEYNAEFLGQYITISGQAIEVAEALEELGFVKCKEIINFHNTRIEVSDENGMIVSLHQTLNGGYYDRIDTEDGETTLWEWEYTDKYEKAFYEQIENSIKEYEKATE